MVWCFLHICLFMLQQNINILFGVRGLKAYETLFKQPDVVLSAGLHDHAMRQLSAFAQLQTELALQQ